MHGWYSSRLRLVPLLLLSFLIAACGSTSAELSGNDVEVEPNKQVQDRCTQSLDFGIFQLEPAGRIASLGEEFQLGTLGEQGALDLANELFSLEDSFCALEIPPALAQALEEVDQLFDSGQATLADQKLQALLADIGGEAFSTQSRLKNALQPDPQYRAQTRRAVRSYLAIAARAQFWGNDARADEALASATSTYEAWASEAIDGADIKEALTIAAEAQLLGLFELGDEAIARAADLAEADLVRALEAFEPCLASVQEARRLLRTAATSMLLGVDGNEYGFDNEFETWLDIYQRRQRGEAVPECDTWQVNLNLDTVWESGRHTISWEGFFIVHEDGELEGQGSGSLSTHVEVSCIDLMSGNEFLSTTDVTGTFSFEIQGKQEEHEDLTVYKFQFPARVTVTGVDTCNPFEEATYLPKYVIEEIQGSGGVEGYDMASDQIYLVVPALDGTSKDFETIIGPVTLTLKGPEIAK